MYRSGFFFIYLDIQWLTCIYIITATGIYCLAKFKNTHLLLQKKLQCYVGICENIVQPLAHSLPINFTLTPPFDAVIEIIDSVILYNWPDRFLPSQLSYNTHTVHSSWFQLSVSCVYILYLYHFADCAANAFLLVWFPFDIDFGSVLSSWSTIALQIQAERISYEGKKRSNRRGGG